MSRVLLGVTGSVAAVKTRGVFGGLRSAGHEAKVVPTAAALSFFDAAELNATSAPGSLPVRGQSVCYVDADEWPEGRLFHLGEPVLHIELRKWADLLLIAPLDANTLAKLSLGLCDNLLTCVYRAWDFSRPVVLAPAMNTLMWEHPATVRHLTQLALDHGAHSPLPRAADDLCAAINQGCPRLRVVSPISKRLACGDEGVGGMAGAKEIVQSVGELLRSPPGAAS
jgi:phosphopantothenoylcysteine decarboxylase